MLCALDLLELDGRDPARQPIEERKRTLAKLVGGPHPGIAINEHHVGDGDMVYRQACRLGCEGIVSNRLGLAYRSGRSKQWIKLKNPAAPAVAREVEEDWDVKRAKAARSAKTCFVAVRKNLQKMI
jgi:ATP-dependent DNA ligase